VIEDFARVFGDPLVGRILPGLFGDLIIGPTFLRLLLPFGLADVTERYAEELLETIWQGIAPAGDP
jgi:hypothetical protein